MAAKIIQRCWRSASSSSAIDTARLFSSASRFPHHDHHQSTIPNNHRLSLSSANRSNPLLLATAQPGLFSSSSSSSSAACAARRSLSTFASPLRNLSDPKRSADTKPLHQDAYVMNLTVRDSNVIKLGTSDRRQMNPSSSVDGGGGGGNSVEDISKLGLFKRFKALYKQYWYVMLPVHIVTSTGWMVGFYYMSQSGVDVAEMLRTIHVSETIVSKMENSPTGHLAIAYLCYKIATPVRYMVTIGGTTLSINYLSRWGYIKPIPSKENLMKMYDEKAAQVKSACDEAMTNYKKRSGNQKQ